MVMLALLLVPMLSFAVLFSAQVGLTIVTKLRLQTAADQAVYDAAKSLAHDLDALSRDNWTIRLHHRQLEQAFARSTQKDDADGKRRIAEAQARIDHARERMEDVLTHGYARACDAALAAVRRDVPWARVVPLSGHVQVADATDAPCRAQDRLFTFSGDRLETAQWLDREFAYPEGGGAFFDPARISTDRDELLSYRLKPTGPDQQVAFALRLEAPHLANWLAPLWPDLATNGALTLRASAAAQPVGGDIKAAGWLAIEGDRTDDAAWNAAYDMQRYHPTLVPLARLQDRAAGYAGLAFFDESTDTWMRDEERYAQ